MYGRGHGVGPAPRRQRYHAVGQPLTPQQQAAKVVAGVRKGMDEGIEAFQSLDYWTRDPVVQALAAAQLATAASVRPGTSEMSWQTAEIPAPQPPHEEDIAMQNGSTLPLTPQVGIDWRATFTQILLGLAERAKAGLPQSHSRIDKAVDIVLNRDVVPDSDGRYTVGSQSDHGTYMVQGSECDCPDWNKAPDHHCKHRIAAALWYKATAELQARQAGHVADPALQANGHKPAPVDIAARVAEAEHPLPEAPASANCYIEVAGRQVQVTLRDTDETRLLERLAALLAQYPVAAPSQGQAPAGDTSGKLCPMHQTAMRKHTNDRGSWWSHKAADGSWCRGK